MADQEIAKHTKNIFRLVLQKEHPLWHKLGEIVLEIAIIVFAVSFSIWLHQQSEHRHEQEEVKTFLLGLADDLRGDRRSIENLIAVYHQYDKNFAYLNNLDAAHPPSDEEFDKAYQFGFSNINYRPSVSRYEGFKSSGKLDHIENAKLSNDILALYQEVIPRVHSSENGWIFSQERYTEFLEHGLDEDDTRALRFKLLTSKKGKRLTAAAATYPQLYERFADIKDMEKEIIAEIEKEYPGEVREKSSGSH